MTFTPTIPSCYWNDYIYFSYHIICWSHGIMESRKSAAGNALAMQRIDYAVCYCDLWYIQMREVANENERGINNRSCFTSRRWILHSLFWRWCKAITFNRLKAKVSSIYGQHQQPEQQQIASSRGRTQREQDGGCSFCFKVNVCPILFQIDLIQKQSIKLNKIKIHLCRQFPFSSSV